MTEKEFMRQVISLATELGWEYYHTHDSRRSPSGFPDLVLVRPHDRIICAELKTATGKVTEAQHGWLSTLGTVCEAYVWRPEQWDDIVSVLAYRKGGGA